MIPEPPANSHMTHSVVVSQRLLRCLPASIFTRHILLTRCKSIQNHFFFYSTFSNQNQKPQMCDWHGAIWIERSGSMRQGGMKNFPARNSSAITETWGAQDAVETDHWEQTVVIAVYFKKNTTCHHTPKWKSVSSVYDKQNGVHLYMKINGPYSVLGNQH